MGNRRECLVCRTPFGAEDVFCFKCGAKIDGEVLDEAASIDYLLNEIKEWPTWVTIPTETEKQLIEHYETRIVRITDSIRALPPIVIPPIETIPPPPPALFVETRPQPTDAVVNLSALEAIIADTIAPDPPQITFVEPAPIVETKPIVAPPVEVVIAPPLMETFIEEEPEAPRKSIAELVAENIKLIFAISAALFVGGILLYYRNELYLGLKQPITQAVILGFVTVSLIVAGWTLVRRTQQTLAGRTLTLVGSLLVPINPWFLVRTQLIPQSSNGWILGLACTALYGWTAYFLKEKLYVYLALVTGIITGWAAVFQFTNGADTSAYSVVLMAFSIAYLLAENFVRRIADREENADVDFGSPFFHVAQIGMALSLLFYTPLVTFVPFEFVAAKRYFDPQGYSSLTAWLALCAAFGYFYSGLNRRHRIFVYLGITALLCAESSALYNLEVALPTAVLVYVLTALGMMVIARSGRASNFYARPLSHVGILASLGMICWATALFGLSLDKYQQIIPSWRIVLSIALGAIILSVDALGRKTSEFLFGALFLFSAAVIFGADKLGVEHQAFPVIFLVPAYALLLLHKRTPDEDKPYPREHFHALALVLTGCIIAGTAFLGDIWLEHQLTLSALALGIAGLSAISARKTIEQNPRFTQSYLALVFGAFSYAVFLNWTGLPVQTTLCVGMLYPFVLLLAATRYKERTAAYFGRLIGEMVGLRSAAIFFAMFITALSAASGPFAEHEITRSILMVELSSFFAVAGLYTKDELARPLQLYVSLIFGALSYTALLHRFGPAITPSLCLAMVYPFGLLGLSMWQKHSRSERLTTLSKESFVLRSSAISASVLILGISILSRSFLTNEFAYVILMFQFALFFGVSGFNSSDQLSRIVQFYTSLLFGGIAIATALNYSNIPLNISLCLGMLYPFALLLAATLYRERSAAYFGRLTGYMVALRSTATFFAVVITALSAASRPFTEHEFTRSILMLELSSFFAIAGLYTKNEFARALQLYVSVIFGAVSYVALLHQFGPGFAPSLCLAMIYPFGLLGLSIWQKSPRSERSNDLSKDSFVLSSSAIAAAILILVGSILSRSFLTSEFVSAILMFQLAVFFGISGLNSGNRLNRIVQFYASLLFGGLSYATTAHYSNIPLDTSLCLGMFYPFAIFGISRALKNTSAISSQKLIEIRGALRISAIVFATAIASLMFAPGAVDANSLTQTVLLLELAVFFGLSGFNSDVSISRLIQFFAALSFGIFSFGYALLYLHIPDSSQVPVILVLPYLMLAVAAFIYMKNAAAINAQNDDQLDVRSAFVNKLTDLRLTLIGWSILLTGYGIIACVAFNSTSGQSIDYSILAAEIVGLLVILGHLGANRVISYISFLAASLFSAICLNSVLQFAGLTSLMERPFAFALMVLSFYLISQQNRVREELRDSLSIASTSIAVCVFFRSILSFVDFRNSQDQALPVLLIAPLLVIGVKEIIHLARTRNTFHTIFSLLIGFALAGKLLGIANVEFATVIIWIECLSLAYMVGANFLRQRQVEPEVVVPIEILANLAMAICWILALTSDIPFNLRTCVAITIATVFYAIGALQRKSEFIGRIYAHVASSVSLITVVAFLNHFGLGNVSDASTVLLPLLSIYVLAEYLLKKSVFRESLFNIAQAVFPVVAILQFQDGLKSHSNAIESTVFFAEISVFYLLSALQKKLSGLIYPGIAALGPAIWFGLHASNIDSGYITPFYAIFGFGLLLLQKQLSEKQNWSTEAIDNCGHITLALAAIGAVGQSIAHMHLGNSALTSAIVSLLVIIGIVTAISFIERDSEVKRLYRIAAAALVFITYITFGIRLGYHLIGATEFYSVPMGALLLVAGYIQVRKKRDLATIWLWIGSALLAVPILLHALEYRFIREQSSTTYDVALLVISLTLILGGILEHLKAPTIIGGSSFLIVMSVIVFSYVDWEQKTLSISMIVLALILFVSSWIIYSFYKRNQLGAISRQGKQVIEEFGKWR